MVFLVQSFDGELVSILTILKEKEGLEWIDRMDNIKKEAANIVRRFPLANTQPTAASQRAILGWLRLVKDSRRIGMWPTWYISPSIRQEEAVFKTIIQMTVAHPESRLECFHEKLVHLANQKLNEEDE
jgi:hypothetical protein